MIVAHWPDGSETVIPDGIGVSFDEDRKTDVVYSDIDQDLAAFPSGECRFSFRRAAATAIFKERPSPTATDLDVSWSPV